MNTIRVFIAIELPANLLSRLAEIQAQLKATLPKGLVRWVHTQGIHLTVKFLGEIPLSQSNLIQSAMARASCDIPAFTFAVGQLGCFPNPRQPRVVWVGIQEPSGTLERLQRAIEAAIAPLGYPTESRPFNAHLTLGRVARQASPGDVRKLGETILATKVEELGQVSAHEVALIQSQLKPSGAEYTALARVPLKPET